MAIAVPRGCGVCMWLWVMYMGQMLQLDVHPLEVANGKPSMAFSHHVDIYLDQVFLCSVYKFPVFSSRLVFVHSSFILAVQLADWGCFRKNNKTMVLLII